MQLVNKGQAIYVAVMGLLTVLLLSLLLALLDCRQDSDLIACSLRWGNFGLSVQYSDHLVIWLLGLNDIRLWPLRQNIPLALLVSVILMTISLVGLGLTLLIASVDQIIQTFRRS
ncbi:MAG: hypothetical protein AAF629_27080 [Chloroflexota bacterium]